METARIATRFVSLPPCRRIEPSNRRNHPQQLRVTCGEKKEKKKLVKGLEKDLALFANMRFGIDPKSGCSGGVQESMITEAAEVIIRQLRCVREADEETKRQMKQEKKKHKVKSMRMQAEVIEHESTQHSCLSTPVEDTQCFTNAAEEVAQSCSEDYDEQHKRQLDLSSKSSIVPHPSQKQTSPKKVEICMGRKCKKSGAPQLLEQMQSLAAREENMNVVGCKCLGKCKTSPNVRLSSSDTALTICSSFQLSDVDSTISDFLEL